MTLEEFNNLLAADTYQWILGYMERNDLSFWEAVADILNVITEDFN